MNEQGINKFQLRRQTVLSAAQIRQLYERLEDEGIAHELIIGERWRKGARRIELDCKPEDKGRVNRIVISIITGEYDEH